MAYKLEVGLSCLFGIFSSIAVFSSGTERGIFTGNLIACVLFCKILKRPVIVETFRVHWRSNSENYCYLSTDMPIMFFIS